MNGVGGGFVYGFARKNYIPAKVFWNVVDQYSIWFNSSVRYNVLTNILNAFSFIKCSRIMFLRNNRYMALCYSTRFITIYCLKKKKRFLVSIYIMVM